MSSSHINELITILTISFNWNKARINCLSNILLSLFVVRTVNLAELSAVFSGTAKKTSNYKRLQRFLVWLSKVKFYQELIFKFVIKQISQSKFILSMDRTNWKFRGKDINILVLGVYYQGVSIPLLWFCLGRAGNSDVNDKIRIIQDALKKIDKSRIEYLLADREFVGKEWFKFLIDKEIQFAIRVKDCYKIEFYKNGNLKKATIKKAFKGIAKDQKLKIKKCTLFGCEINLAACLSSEGDLVVVATNSARPLSALKLYKKRWSIETLFSCLKGRGFNFEDTHITGSDRIEALIFVLTLAVFWSMKAGLVLTEKKPVKPGSHGRPRISIFRRGLDLIRKSIVQMIHLLGQLFKLIQLLAPSNDLEADFEWFE